MRIPKVPLYLNYMYIVDRTQRIPTSVQRSLFSYAVMLGQTLNKTAIHIRKKRDEADKHGSPFLNVCTYYTAFYHENQLQLKKGGRQIQNLKGNIAIIDTCYYNVYRSVHVVCTCGVSIVREFKIHRSFAQSGFNRLITMFLVDFIRGMYIQPCYFRLFYTIFSVFADCFRMFLKSITYTH